MFAHALKSYFSFVHRSISAKAVLLPSTERSAGFYEVDLLNA